MKVLKNKMVALEYSLVDEEGNLLDSNEGYMPIEYLHGAGNIVLGLEEALEGQCAGETIETCLAPESAYGPYRDELKMVYSLRRLNITNDTEPGTIIQLPDGKDVVVIEINKSFVTVDANHPLAGKTLFYKVKIVAVRDATEAEINAGMPLPEYNSRYCGIPGCYC